MATILGIVILVLLISSLTQSGRFRRNLLSFAVSAGKLLALFIAAIVFLGIVILAIPAMLVGIAKIIADLCILVLVLLIIWVFVK